MNPGTIHHARWLTTANRILRLYVSTSNPSNSLSILVDYIMKVYVPVWFAIKCNSCANQGSKHLFQLIQRSRFLPTKYRTIVDKVIQNNSYFAHSENILLAMLNDDFLAIRELAVRRIMKAKDGGATTLRRFQLPKVIFDAPVYHMMIDWQESQIETFKQHLHITTTTFIYI